MGSNSRAAPASCKVIGTSALSALDGEVVAHHGIDG